MRCPALSELPSPPRNRTGWPWTTETPQLSTRRPDGSLWPRISVVTPSYNQGRFLEETIRSVLLQGYPNLEYIIIDGGSNDETLSVIKRYERWLTHWVSEKDCGQSHAINKGLGRASGVIFNWLNSDDFLAPSALSILGSSYSPGSTLAGEVVEFGDGHDARVKNEGLTASNLIGGTATFRQQAFWMETEALREIGLLDESLHYAFDWELAIRALHRSNYVIYLNETLAFFRFHSESKTIALPFAWPPEVRRVWQKIREDPKLGSLHRACDFALKRMMWRDEIASLDKLHNGHGRALAIIIGALKDPLTRLDRFTVGSILRAVQQHS